MEWERWAAELLESHISYPILCYYRSQHDNQSWLSAMISVMDVCALLITTIEGPASRQAQLTFAVARHALIDLGHVFHLEQRAEAVLRSESPETNRLPPESFDRLCNAIADVEIRLCADPEATRRLNAIRLFYEPAATALGEYLRLALPLWVTDKEPSESWRTVSRLSTDATGVLAGAAHVSEQSTAARLDQEQHEF